MDILVDRKIYSDNCITKAVYWLSRDYLIIRTIAGDNEKICFSPKQGAKTDKEIQSEVFDKLNDFKLRQIIENETHDIRTILYAKAFSESDCLEDV